MFELGVGFTRSIGHQLMCHLTSHQAQKSLNFHRVKVRQRMLSSSVVAIVGCGAFGQYHVREWSKLVGVQRVCIVERDDEVAAQRSDIIARQLGVSAGDFRGVFGGIVDVLAQLSDLKFASVVTPHESHSQLAATLLGAGVNVLIEKPAVPISFSLDENGVLPTAPVEERPAAVAGKQ